MISCWCVSNFLQLKHDLKEKTLCSFCPFVKQKAQEMWLLQALWLLNQQDTERRVQTKHDKGIKQGGHFEEILHRINTDGKNKHTQQVSEIDCSGHSPQQ